MQIVEIAKQYVGKKEKSGNIGFVDSQMEKDMRAVGWQPGWAWCSSFAELILWKAYPNRINELKGFFVPSAVNTFRNLTKAGYKTSMVPTVGSFVFWQRMKDGNSQWTGHAGIVVEVINEKEFKSVEGNTNGAGSREGDGVYLKTRVVNPNVEDGLKVIGFVTI
jgi:hypothetical protein